jgi:hypothetical protein
VGGGGPGALRSTGVGHYPPPPPPPDLPRCSYWNSLFDIGKDAKLRVDDYTLVVEVWDEDQWSSDDHIGVVKIPLWNIPRVWGTQPALDLWMPLHPGKPWIMGELQHMFQGVMENERLLHLANYTQRHTVNQIESSLMVLGTKWRNNVTNDFYMPASVASSYVWSRARRRAGGGERLGYRQPGGRAAGQASERAKRASKMSGRASEVKLAGGRARDAGAQAKNRANTGPVAYPQPPPPPLPPPSGWARSLSASGQSCRSRSWPSSRASSTCTRWTSTRTPPSTTPSSAVDAPIGSRRGTGTTWSLSTRRFGERWVLRRMGLDDGGHPR